MAYYYGLRGWLEFGNSYFPQIRDAIQRINEEHTEEGKPQYYLKGWCWNEDYIWVRYLFYGADVKQDGIDYFKEILKEIEELNIEVYGYFHAQGEGDEVGYTYKIEAGSISIEETGPLYDTSFRDIDTKD